MGQPDASLPASWRLPRRWLVSLFALALVVRLAHVLALTQSPYFANPVVDAAEYDTIGWSLAHRRGHPDRVFWHPPGYPCFLGSVWWLFGDSYLAPRLIQALLGALSVVLVAWIGSRPFGPHVGLAGGLGAGDTVVLPTKTTIDSSGNPLANFADTQVVLLNAGVNVIYGSPSGDSGSGSSTTQ